MYYYTHQIYFNFKQFGIKLIKHAYINYSNNPFYITVTTSVYIIRVTTHKSFILHGYTEASTFIN